MLMRAVATLCAFAFLAMTAAAPARAQANDPQLRGPWLGGGIGGASARVNCDICNGERNNGLSGYLTGGLAVSRKVRAGAEFSGWFDNTDDVNQRLALLGASLYWHPRATNTWYLKGGLGLLRYHADDEGDDDPLKARTGAIQLGGGYDFRTSRKLWLTTFANLIVSTRGDLTSGNAVVTDASFSMLQIGAGLTWR